MEKLPTALVVLLNNMRWYPTEEECWQSHVLSPEESERLSKQIMDKWGDVIRHDKELFFTKDYKINFHWRLLEDLANSGVAFAKQIVYPATKKDDSPPSL